MDQSVEQSQAVRMVYETLATNTPPNIFHLSFSRISIRRSLSNSTQTEFTSSCRDHLASCDLFERIRTGTEQHEGRDMNCRPSTGFRSLDPFGAAGPRRQMVSSFCFNHSLLPMDLDSCARHLLWLVVLPATCGIRLVLTASGRSNTYSTGQQRILIEMLLPFQLRIRLIPIVSTTVSTTALSVILALSFTCSDFGGILYYTGFSCKSCHQSGAVSRTAGILKSVQS